MVGLSDYNVTSGFFLSGSPAAPVVNNNFIFLNGNPSNGTIYRFTRNITGIEESAGTLRSATLLPNPVRDMALLRLSGAAPQQAVLTITDIQGRVVRSIGDIRENEITISREGMEPGYYLFRLTEGDHLLARGKFIVQ